MADLLMRCHWAIRDAEDACNTLDSCLERGVTIERHYAINWLIYGEDWDEVQTDT